MQSINSNTERGEDYRHYHPPSNIACLDRACYREWLCSLLDDPEEEETYQHEHHGVECYSRECYRHSHTGEEKDCFKPKCASPLITKIGEPYMEYETTEDKIAKLEARIQRQKKFVNEVVAFANSLEKRIEKLEKE